MKVAYLDHNDSFTNNVIALLESACNALAEVVIFSPEDTIEMVKEFMPDLIVIGPGPGRPSHYPLLQKVFQAFQEKPILGICLGMQAINEFFGGKTIESIEPKHGKVSDIHHSNADIFKGISNPFRAMRYHSLQIQATSHLQILAHSKDVPMVIKVNGKNIYGIQFHPESFGSEYGERLLQNILEVSFAN